VSLFASASDSLVVLLFAVLSAEKESNEVEAEESLSSNKEGEPSYAGESSIARNMM